MTDSASQLVLASASPRRSELLERVGISFSVVPSNISEDEIAGESPAGHVRRLSEAKAREVAGRPGQPGRFFIGSDTVVVLDDRILGKPADEIEAAAMLRSLSGRQHQVWSGYAVYDRERNRCEAEAVCTEVFFRELSEADIAAYIATGEPADKAGAYAIQGIGTFMVRRIEGSYTNVVGLPLCELLDTLQRMGAARPLANPGRQR
ncbi:septum formation protein [Geothermobacter ehrlichii]|uniref:dTTP/UTP pyrophosphatase n=1 Tax=Geothermobacter ehrlichii TaxID=213224 RepID=A0A5D3WK17_9BACT|nr:Maf family nucleotide pyrophosphatase [Geothermobacter ehrlichii]TYO98951.1 septum formation protein [Geothermobacter ehrlichii]